MGFFSRNKNKEKFDVAEASRQLKRSTNMSKNANPLKAMTEEEPWAQAQGRNIAISQLKHKDMHGNEIVDPDRSNPTRYRFERPLDTIRSFERAIHRDDRERDPKRRSTRNSRNTEEMDGHHKKGSHENQSNYGRNMNESPGRGPSDSFENASLYRENNIQGSRNPYAPRNRSNTENLYGADPNRGAPVSGPSDNETGTASLFSGEGMASTQERYSTDPSSESSSYGRRESDNYTTGQYKPGHGQHPSQGASSYDGPQYTYNNGIPARHNSQIFQNENSFSPVSPTFEGSAAQQRGPQSGNQQYIKQPHVATAQRPQQNPYPSYQSSIPRSLQKVQTPVVPSPTEKRRSWLKSKLTRT